MAFLPWSQLFWVRLYNKSQGQIGKLATENPIPNYQTTFFTADACLIVQRGDLVLIGGSKAR